ncbi:peptidylprolyl isomerase [Caulobacter mirabilis]|uniref:Parvulin-like PPIase n=1 Tax=Caulobacter mirabilis TaxID=69666 RepID=A0A2D2AUI1_9CAUL|nr:peptidyl-prolyl cis-trans isomerase [Caulobacter mirabilis]ATQ41623.1 peptidylprolyl isomerase [Caulobacter mirabilis]
MKIARHGAWSALLALALVFTVAACDRNKGSERPPEAGDTAVARVDGRAIWASDVKREAVAQGLIGEGEPLDVSSDLFRRVLDEVVDQRLLAAEAIRQKLDKDPIAQQRIRAAEQRILADMVVEGVVEKKVTESAIRGLYQEQLRLSRQSDEMKARQIVVPSQAQAEEIKKLITAGASFEALAMERSTDAATRFSGGDFGGYFTLDVMPEAYTAALKDAKAGDMVGPFPVEGGFALVRVEEKRQEAPITLEAARPQIVRFLTYDEVRELLENLRGKAKVEVLLGKQPDVPGAPREPASAPPGPPPAAAAPAAPQPAAPVVPAPPAKK